MTAHCSYFRSSKAFTTLCALYCSEDGSGLLILPLVSGFPDGLQTVLFHRWQRIAHSSARQRLTRFAQRIAQRMSADCLYLPLSTAFPAVRAPYCSADSIGLHVLPLVNSFHDGLCPVFLGGWHWIAHSFSHQRLSRFTRCIAHRMVVDCSNLLWSMAFPMVCAPYCSVDDSVLLILPLIKVFHSLRIELLYGWQQITHTSAHQQLS